MYFRKSIFCSALLVVLLFLFPLSAAAQTQNDYHTLCQKAAQSGASPTEALTGRDVSNLLNESLSESDEPLTLSGLCALMRAYLHREKLVLPSLRDAPYLTETNADILYCYQGGILSVPEDPKAPVSLGQGCMILSRLLSHARAPDYDQPVSSMEADESVGVDTLENTLIMGHSNVVGLYLTVDSPLTYAAKDAVSTYDYLSQPDLIFDWERVGTAMQALQAGQYEKVYIMLGTNDCMWYYAGIPDYQSQLAEIIELVQVFQPEAKLCLIGISPIGFSDIIVREELRPDVIRAYNQVQKSLSRDYGIAYLDIYSFLADENGYNYREISRNDGIHYTVEGYQSLLREIYTHPLK